MSTVEHRPVSLTRADRLQLITTFVIAVGLTASIGRTLAFTLVYPDPVWVSWVASAVMVAALLAFAQRHRWLAVASAALMAPVTAWMAASLAWQDAITTMVLALVAAAVLAVSAARATGYWRRAEPAASGPDTCWAYGGWRCSHCRPGWRAWHSRWPRGAGRS